eukprot:7838018-Ditylum_brightwellii.AAC.1
MSQFRKTSCQKVQEFFVTITVCVTMTWRSATLYKPAGSMFSPHTVSRSSRGSSRSGLLRTPKRDPRNAG